MTVIIFFKVRKIPSSHQMHQSTRMRRISVDKILSHEGIHEGILVSGLPGIINEHLMRALILVLAWLLPPFSSVRSRPVESVVISDPSLPPFSALHKFLDSRVHYQRRLLEEKD